MPVDNFNITDEEIEFAEEVLLPEEAEFDEERKKFIRDLTTLDLHAVPGSGKTTALLAKLLILEQKMPFKDGSGILVISHTNTAVDEIKEKIGDYCPKLFSYPNFVGTIQSFVDKFLAKRFVENVLDCRVQYIDTDKYKNELWNEYLKISWAKKFNQPAKIFWGRNIGKAKEIAENCSQNKEDLCKQLIEKDVKNIYFDFSTEAIKVFRNNSIVIAKSENKRYQGIKTAIMEVIKSGIISYEYAYKFGIFCLEYFPRTRELLQSRFKYVFVDEMQDMDKDQYQVLEDIFYDNGESESIYQRIGDRNQSIYNGSANLDKIWQPRDKELNITGSHRFSSNIADVVKYFALSYKEIEAIEKDESCDLPPHLIIYNDETCRCKLIHKFVKKIKEYQAEGKLPLELKHPVKAVAWTAKEKEEDKITLHDYCPKIKEERAKSNIEYNSLESYLIYYDEEIKMLKEVNKNIIKALIRILKIEEIKNEEGRYYSKRKLFKELKDKDPETYKNLKFKLYNWCTSLIRGQKVEVLAEIRTYIEEFLTIFNTEVEKSHDFIHREPEKYDNSISDEVDYNCELCQINNKSLYINTVHSVKGETHTATLYLESYFHNDGSKDVPISYESQRLHKQFKERILNTNKKRIKKSAKVTYVGFSRPTHLLAFGVHVDRYEKYLRNIDRNKWEIIMV